MGSAALTRKGLLLAIDTSGPRCSAAVCSASAGILCSDQPEIGRGHAEGLAGVVAGVLHAAGTSYADLDAIAVCVGPGSFAGIRVGVAYARALSLALDIRAVAVDALEALAEPWLAAQADVLVVQDARRGEVYAARYAPDGAVVEPPGVVAADRIGPANAGRGPLLLVGSGAEAVLAGHSQEAWRVVCPSPLVEIGAVARLGLGRASGAPPRPLYLRGADAKAQRTAGLTQSGLTPAARPVKP